MILIAISLAIILALLAIGLTGMIITHYDGDQE